MELVIVTGMSGAGRSTAANALEDIGYYCIDNIPPTLIKMMAEFSATNSEITKFAIVTDIRSRSVFKSAYGVLDELKKTYDAKIVFLDASDEALARRYKQTRRSHPLTANDNLISTVDAIKKEREALSALREIADYVIDTSMLSMASLKEKISGLFLDDAGAGMRIECISFGFKYGTVSDADMLLDVRCLINPYYVDELRELTGLSPKIHDYIMAEPKSTEFTEKLFNFMDCAVPMYIAEGKTRLVIAIGCTGGKHRSVTVTEMLHKHLKSLGYTVTVDHRDINKV